ncbi:MAG: L-asparaginase / beta-aspartyl-peptidase [Tenuifilum sp.]|uniref:isoaspartyl peptidase/L-asparaginase family protein n=1 Tax=Tenuifilum sp. TaxID=2760880 RepID=UPI0024AA5D24|nr:isoaspartyl peptidase/L-asparaginase [Tenuifilum sp.]MDI3527275.1 L-asparaginase / beta-aspartyl-peptidase [Tenuifilum sp.]
MCKIIKIVLIAIVLNVQNIYSQNWSIAIHGGAGNMKPEHFTKEQLDEYKAELNKALSIGVAILKSGGSSLDAVEQVVRYLEDCPLFNAGKGAVFTHEGRNELDAAIMDGKTLNAGAVAGVRNVKNPISLARKVMEASPHVMLSGSGASEFAREQGLELVDSSYFFTKSRWESLQRVLSKEKMGTVGCVALDTHGNLAAATSTGGMTNKRWGRIGDSPIIGAGTYANNATCAVSATGHGEYFIRYTVAHDISALMEYQNLSLNAAAERVVMGKLLNAGGFGGIIAVDKMGNICTLMNTTGMFRAFASSKGLKGCEVF